MKHELIIENIGIRRLLCRADILRFFPIYVRFTTFALIPINTCPYQDSAYVFCSKRVSRSISIMWHNVVSTEATFGIACDKNSE